MFVVEMCIQYRNVLTSVLFGMLSTRDLSFIQLEPNEVVVTL